MKLGGYQQSMIEATSASPRRRWSVGVTQTTSHPGRGPRPSWSAVGRYSNWAVTGGNVGDGVIIGRYASRGRAAGGVASPVALRPRRGPTARVATAKPPPVPHPEE